MRRRWNGAPMQWLNGVIFTAVGAGMFLACLLPRCTYILAVLLIMLGIYLIKK